ncbi:MAG: PAS domain S-box protein, partial [Deltaproteobacteria bacterium]|nr:PAS domain S-box protein [Deltaproteobacteria bacterium]
MEKNKKISTLLLNKVLELLPSGIILIDSRDIIQFINKEVSILFSMNLDFIGSNIRDIFKKVLNSVSIIDSDKGFISDIIDRNEVVRKYLLNKDILLNYINCDNSEFFISLYAFRITVGKEEYLALFVEDKTSQRNIEIKLIHNRDLFQTILESTGDLYVFFDREGKIIEINEKSAKLVGLSKNEIIGRSIWDFIDGKDESQYSKLVERLTATGKSATILDRRYGIILERSFYPVKDENGKVINAVIISKDVTERVRDKELEEDIERMIRHDLKSPLNTILGF